MGIHKCGSESNFPVQQCIIISKHKSSGWYGLLPWNLSSKPTRQRTRPISIPAWTMICWRSQGKHRQIQSLRDWQAVVLQWRDPLSLPGLLRHSCCERSSHTEMTIVKFVFKSSSTAIWNGESLTFSIPFSFQTASVTIAPREQRISIWCVTVYSTGTVGIKIWSPQNTESLPGRLLA